MSSTDIVVQPRNDADRVQCERNVTAQPGDASAEQASRAKSGLQCALNRNHAGAARRAEVERIDDGFVDRPVLKHDADSARTGGSPSFDWTYQCVHVVLVQRDAIVRKKASRVCHRRHAGGQSKRGVTEYTSKNRLWPIDP